MREGHRPEAPLPGFPPVTPPPRGHIVYLPEEPKGFQSRLPVLIVPSAKTQERALRLLRTRPWDTTGLAVFDTAFTPGRANVRFKELALVLAGPNLVATEVHLFWVHHDGLLPPSPPKLPERWSHLPVVLHHGPEERLLPRFLKLVEGRLLAAHNLGIDQFVLQHWLQRQNIGAPWPSPFPGYDTWRTTQNGKPVPDDRSIIALYEGITGRGAPTKTTVTDALMAFEVAKHQAESSFSLLRRLAARQLATHHHAPLRFQHPERIHWTTEGPVLAWYDGQKSLDEVPLDHIAHLLHSSLPWPEKVRLFRWL